MFATIASCYYVPGAFPEEYIEGYRLQAQVNSLTSSETELPYDYYSMPFCKPPEGISRIKTAVNLGTLLEGLRIENSPYNFSVKEDASNILVCQPEGYYGPLTKAEVTELKHKIDNRYRIRMILDNLPLTMVGVTEAQEFVRPGYDVGFTSNGKHYVNNHLAFKIFVHQTNGEYARARQAYRDAAALDGMDARKLLSILRETRRRLSEGQSPDEAFASVAATTNTTVAYMIVGFEVSPCSVARELGTPEEVACDLGIPVDSKYPPQEVKEGAKIVYTYSVTWEPSNIKWASRWDAYLKMPGGKVHWFSICNSILIVLVMAVLVAMILIRTVRRDLARYEQLVVDSNNLDLKDEAGWKLVSGDVFRAPIDSKVLAVQVGSGVQIICTQVVTLLLATLGFLSPANRGALLTTMMVMYVLLAVTAGQAAVWAHGLMERTYSSWLSVSLWVSVYYPGITMTIFTILNLFIKHTGSSGAVPAGIYFAIVAVWFLVSIPLTFVGGYLATKIPILEYPVKTNQIPRHIPPPPLVAHPVLLFFSAGILPFGTMFIELYFAMTTVWEGYFYYLFGFTFIIGLLVCIINAEISVLCTYVQLCAEDYLWWWRSFQRGGSVAVYIAVYALGFLATTLNNVSGFTAVFVYLCYMGIMILGLYFAMGTIGFMASLWFVYRIFKAVKAD